DDFYTFVYMTARGAVKRRVPRMGRRKWRGSVRIGPALECLWIWPRRRRRGPKGVPYRISMMTKMPMMNAARPTKIMRKTTDDSSAWGSPLEELLTTMRGPPAGTAVISGGNDVTGPPGAAGNMLGARAGPPRPNFVPVGGGGR